MPVPQSRLLLVSNEFFKNLRLSETKELDSLKDIWSIQKNVSLGGLPLKPQGATVQAAPTGTGYYSRHGQHNPTKGTDGGMSSTSILATGHPSKFVRTGR